MSKSKNKKEFQNYQQPTYLYKVKEDIIALGSYNKNNTVYLQSAKLTYSLPIKKYCTTYPLHNLHEDHRFLVDCSTYEI